MLLPSTHPERLEANTSLKRIDRLEPSMLSTLHDFLMLRSSSSPGTPLYIDIALHAKGCHFSKLSAATADGFTVPAFTLFAMLVTYL